MLKEKMEKPNIIMIVADQFRGDALGCVGHPDVKTPNLDKLAKDGVLFSKAYTPNPICVPARATMITGNYSHNCIGTKNNSGTIKENQPKLPEILANNGYATYAAGKLHYVPYSSPGTPRLLHGFQHAALAESGRIIDLYDPKGESHGLEDYFDYLEAVGWKGYSRAHALGNNDLHSCTSPLPQEHCVDAWVASQAISFLDQHQKESPTTPFFLNVGFPKPHPPYDPPEPYNKLYDPRKIVKPAAKKDGLPRTPFCCKDAITHGFNYFSTQAIQVTRSHYFGLISFQDTQIGRIVNYLKEKNLYDNSIIIFTADHGDMLGDFGFIFKCSMYEGSVRIPFIIAYPKKLVKNIISDSLVGLQDIVPTLLELAGIKLEPSVDGTSLTKELLGQGKIVRDFIISYSLDSPQQTYMLRNINYKYIYNETNGIEELYNLKDDPCEEYNQVNFPDQQKRREAMKRLMIKWAKEHGDEMILGGNNLAATHVPPDIKVSFNDKVLGWRWY